MLACHAGGPGSIPGRCKTVFLKLCDVIDYNSFKTPQVFARLNELLPIILYFCKNLEFTEIVLYKISMPFYFKLPFYIALFAFARI